MLKQDEREWFRYQDKVKWARDRMSELGDARDEGLAIGDLIGRIHTCQRVLKLALAPREDLLKLPFEELQS